MSLAKPDRFNPQQAVIRQRFETEPTLDPLLFSPELLRSHFAKKLTWHPEETDENRHIKASQLIEKRGLSGYETRAAILIPIVMRQQGPMILLTKRSQSLSAHAGQISFPGGKFSPEDQNLFATAKREAKEEVGIEDSQIEILGKFPEYWTISGYRVTPVAALVQQGFTLRLNSNEVSQVFEVPMSYLMNPLNFDLRSWESDQGRRHFYTVSFEDHFIWGATAAVLRNFYLFLIAASKKNIA